MKTTKFLALIMFITFSASPTFAAKTTNSTNPSAAESALTNDEVATLNARVIEIHDMDKSELTSTEKSDLKNELNTIKETVKNDPYVYIGSGSLIIILILLIILL